MAEIKKINMFAVEMKDGKIKTFTSEAEAQVCITGMENEEKISKYTAARGCNSKVSKARMNVIVDYLAWVAEGCPEAEVAEEEVAPPEETQEEAFEA
jgi:hypothetical protein